MSFPVTMTNAFENAASLIAQEAVKNAIAKLAERNGFDAEEALAFVMGTGVQIKKEILPRNALPWCGKVFEDDCRALVYKEGLYTQCPQEAVEGDDGEGRKKWCKKCAKQVLENGTPKNGDVYQRSACALMAYKVGKRAAIPYGDYMKRHKISREEAEIAAEKYGMKIDPVQFECKKRGRPTTTLALMITPSQELPKVPEAEQEPFEDVEDEVEEKVSEPVEDVEDETEEKDNELEEEEINEEDGSDSEEGETYTPEHIKSLPIAELRKLAESRGISTKENGKNIQIKQLQKVVMIVLCKDSK
jgi:hypothetical protein